MLQLRHVEIESSKRTAEIEKIVKSINELADMFKARTAVLSESIVFCQARVVADSLMVSICLYIISTGIIRIGDRTRLHARQN